MITFADTIDGVEGIIFLGNNALKKSEKQRKYILNSELDFEIEQTVNRSFNPFLKQQ